MMRLLRDTWFLFVYSLRVTLRTPVWVLLGLFQPLLWLLLFTPLLSQVAEGPGFPPGGALAVFTPGMLVMLALYGTLFVGFGLIAELRAGVLERLAVTPASRLSLVLGRVLRDVVVTLVQAALLVGAAWLLGLRANPAGVAAAIGLMALLALLTSSCSYALALALRTEDGLASSLQFATLPLTLLSGIFLPLTLAPLWMQRLSEVNPLAQVVNATRVLFLGTIADGQVLQGLVLVLVAGSAALIWAARAFRRVAA
jgi:ABC-2 type transport system permease protein